MQKLDANKFSSTLVVVWPKHFSKHALFSCENWGEKENVTPIQKRIHDPFFAVAVIVAFVNNGARWQTTKTWFSLFNISHLRSRSSFLFRFCFPNRESGRCMCFKILLAWMIVEKGEGREIDPHILISHNSNSSHTWSPSLTSRVHWEEFEKLSSLGFTFRSGRNPHSEFFTVAKIQFFDPLKKQLLIAEDGITLLASCRKDFWCVFPPSEMKWKIDYCLHNHDDGALKLTDRKYEWKVQDEMITLKKSWFYV